MRNRSQKHSGKQQNSIGTFQSGKLNLKEVNGTGYCAVGSSAVDGGIGTSKEMEALVNDDDNSGDAGDCMGSEQDGNADVGGGKNIVICFDGTHSKFGPSPYTNLLKFFRMLNKDDPEKQICYYQPGIGASMGVEFDSVFEKYLSKQSIMDNLDAAIAFSLDQHIIEAYKYLVRFYRAGDKVYLFGFSRGAFTARVLSSMIDRVGLLNCGLEDLAESAWAIYSAWEYALQPSQPDYTTTLINEYKKTFSREVPPDIEQLGLFDCVNSVGLVRDRLFPLSTKSGLVKNISHAVSLDERRGKYRQNLIFPFSYKPSFFSLKSTESSSTSSAFSRRITNTNSTYKSSNNSSISSIITKHFGEESRERINNAKSLLNDIEIKLKETSKLSLNSRLYNIEQTKLGATNTSTRTTVAAIDKQKLLDGSYQEVWFPGNHSDVGGGFPPDINGHFLSHVPLRWMFSQAITKGVLFQKQRLINFNKRYSSIDSMLSCNHDMLSFQPGNLTHSITVDESKTVLELSKQIYNKSYIPEFISCGIDNENYTFEEMLSNGAYLTSLKKIKSDLTSNGDSDTKLSPELLHTLEDIFGHYKELPSKPIQGFDGRGRSNVLTTLVWWFVELIPIGTKIEDEDDHWKNFYTPNLGRSRSVPQYSKLHWSVYWRLKYCYDYKPKNLPEYAQRIIDEYNDEAMIQPITNGSLEPVDQVNELIKKHIQETKDDFDQWELENWSNVPDELTPVLEKY